MSGHSIVPQAPGSCCTWTSAWVRRQSAGASTGGSDTVPARVVQVLPGTVVTTAAGAGMAAVLPRHVYVGCSTRSCVLVPLWRTWKLTLYRAAPMGSAYLGPEVELVRPVTTRLLVPPLWTVCEMPAVP